ncbi:MAG: hypothetical protein LBD85_07145 [Oscillospiraceae bacterium]|jgi:hypothetical protein|nr:hypothetical protein [Oscillospiraceae bacterium]
MRYKNFKLVLFCTAPNMVDITRERLKRQLEWFRKYCGCDKVYLEPYRDGLLIPEEQLSNLIKWFKEEGVEVSGALTTTTNDLSETDKEKYRFSGVYCYTNETMRAHLLDTVRYTARHFDEFILDDWFFTYCTCEECRTAKGGRSWEDFRTDQLAEIGELICRAAKEVNPNCKVIIKYPNWSEAYQESGYCPAKQKDIFDLIYTGTETRDTFGTDQHLPRYLSYSLPRLLENYAPGRNGGCWFDPYGCTPIDYFLEQAYLSAFSRAKELTLFCWGSLYKNKVVTPLGLQLDEIDAFLSKAGAPVGTPCYLPDSAQGEDHIEDILGMHGIPLEPTPNFPSGGKAVFLTVQAHKDADIIAKLTEFVKNGGKAIVTSGFVLEALGRGIEELSSIRCKGRRFTADAFRDGAFGGSDSYSRLPLSFPLLEHRNNTTWALAKAVVGEENYPIVLSDHYGKGQMITINVPDEFGLMYNLPAPILNVIRAQFTDVVPFALNGPGEASVFAYDNDTIALYKYTDKLTSGSYELVVNGNADFLEDLTSGLKMPPSSFGVNSSVFRIFMLQPGDLNFYKLHWSAQRVTPAEEFRASSAPNDSKE